MKIISMIIMMSYVFKNVIENYIVKLPILENIQESVIKTQTYIIQNGGQLFFIIIKLANPIKT